MKRPLIWMLLSKSTSFITHKYINNTTIFNKPSECICHNYFYICPRLFGTRLIGTRPTETRLIGTLKIHRVQLERVSLARNLMNARKLTDSQATHLDIEIDQPAFTGQASSHHWSFCNRNKTPVKVRCTYSRFDFVYTRRPFPRLRENRAIDSFKRGK